MSRKRYDGWRQAILRTTRSVCLAFAGIGVICLFCAGPARAQTTGHTVTISWTASASAGVTGYNIYKFFGACPAASTAFTKVNASPLSSTTLTYAENGLADNTTRCYYVTAVSAGGESSPSGTIQITTPSYTPPPATVTTLPPATVSVSST